MSSYIMHMCISDIVKRKLNLTYKFVYGSILPDVIKSITGDRDITHFIKHVIVDGDRRSLPDLQKAINDLKIEDNEIRIGYIRADADRFRRGHPQQEVVNPLHLPSAPLFEAPVRLCAGSQVRCHRGLPGDLQEFL